MGAVIAKNAAAEDIVGDAMKTVAQATARTASTGDAKWQSLAESRLTRSLTLYADRKTALAQVDAQVESLRAVVKQTDDASDATLTVLREKIWNEAGRPGPNDDPNLELLFPEGSDTYTEETLEGTADALEFLAELLRTSGHPKLSAASLEAHAAVVTDLAAKHRAAVAALKGPLARQKLLGKAATVIAKSLRLQLVKLKRAYELEGYSDADIHTVIPDRSKSPAPVAAPKPAPVA